MNRSLAAAAAASALLIHAMQKPEEVAKKRELFEDAAYEHYKESGAKEGLTQVEFTARSESHPDRYHFNELNTAWWGFQAGFMAAAIRGEKVST